MKSWSASSTAVTPVSAYDLLHRNKTSPVEVIPNENHRYARGINIIRCSYPCLIQNPYFSLPLGITELAGPAGAGKTQIALSLCVDCVLQSMEIDVEEGDDNYNNCRNSKKKKAVYILLGGSGRFLQTASKRLQSMVLARCTTRKYRGQQRDDLISNEFDCDFNDGDVNANTETNDIVHEYLTHIFVRWVCNTEELVEVLHTGLPQLLQLHPDISLIVLDGIANLFRIQDELIGGGTNNSNNSRHASSSSSSKWHQNRAVTFFQIANQCKLISFQFEIPFVVINEATSRIQRHNQKDVIGKSQDETNSLVLEPALGLAWSQCVNCSFFVQRKANNTMRHYGLVVDEDSNNVETCSQQHRHSRLLSCIKAPHISSQRSTMEFCIDQSGVIPIPYYDYK